MMDAQVETLADLHRRYDGPIDDRLRDAALNGRYQPAGCILSRASRDLDRLALSTVVARARLCAGLHARPCDRDGFDPAARALTDALHWYRGLGVRTLEARNAVEREGATDSAPRPADVKPSDY